MGSQLRLLTIDARILLANDSDHGHDGGGDDGDAGDHDDHEVAEILLLLPQEPLQSVPIAHGDDHVHDVHADGDYDDDSRDQDVVEAEKVLLLVISLHHVPISHDDAHSHDADGHGLDDHRYRGSEVLSRDNLASSAAFKISDCGSVYIWIDNKMEMEKRGSHFRSRWFRG